MSKMSKDTARAIEVWTAAEGLPAIIWPWRWERVMHEHNMNTTLRTAAKYMGYTKHEEWPQCPDDWDEADDGEWLCFRPDVWYTKD